MSQINSYIKDDFQVVLLLSCFMGHPVTRIRRFESRLSSIFKFKTFWLYSRATTVNSENNN